MSTFDERARTWDDDPSKVERAQVVARSIRAAVRMHGSTRLFEYGAGTGLVTQELAADVGMVTLADSSAGMREVMEAKVALGSLPSNARVWGLNLVTDPPPAERFDLVVTVMTLHHVPDLAPVLRGFVDLLDDDGRLCVIDLEQEDGAFHRNHKDFDGHDGFAHGELADQLRSAGFDDVQFAPCHEVEKDGRTYPLFLAVARRPFR